MRVGHRFSWGYSYFERCIFAKVPYRQERQHAKLPRKFSQKRSQMNPNDGLVNNSCSISKLWFSYLRICEKQLGHKQTHLTPCQSALNQTIHAQWFQVASQAWKSLIGIIGTSKKKLWLIVNTKNGTLINPIFEPFQSSWWVSAVSDPTKEVWVSSSLLHIFFPIVSSLFLGSSRGFTYFFSSEIKPLPSFFSAYNKNIQVNYRFFMLFHHRTSFHPFFQSSNRPTCSNWWTPAQPPRRSWASASNVRRNSSGIWSDGWENDGMMLFLFGRFQMFSVPFQWDDQCKACCSFFATVFSYGIENRGPWVQAADLGWAAALPAAHVAGDPMALDGQTRRGVVGAGHLAAEALG